jgi:MEMO1 family protein
MAAVHVSPYSGSWYPDDPAELKRLLDGLFAESERRTGPYLLANGLGFVTPHAGLQYSGTVAAAAYRHLQRSDPRRVFILGFAHRGGPAGVAIPDIEGYQTPLGTVPVDRATMERLAAQPPFRFAAEDGICDHSIEIQLPLLQRAAPQAAVVPLYVGRLDAPARDRAAEILAGLWAPGSAFLVSSDLTHYGRSFGYQPFPVDQHVGERLARLDLGVMDAAASLDPNVFHAKLEESGATVCGVSPIGLWLRVVAAIQGHEIFQETLDYQTSGEITGDYHHVVSYGALGYFPAQSFALDAADRALLLESAEATLRHLRATRDARPIPPHEMTPALSRKAGVFVGLHQRGRLLGCVGNHSACGSLAEGVPRMTLRAALDDPRFPGVLAVGGDIEVEISVLSPLKPVRDERAFRINLHGALLESGGRQALLLPQVSVGRDWNSEQFLSVLSCKAGLGSQGYRNPDARLSVFRAQVFATPQPSDCLLTA